MIQHTDPEIHNLIEAVLRRVVVMSRRTASLVDNLIAEQHDAIGEQNPDIERRSKGAHSDPTPGMVKALQDSRRNRQAILDAIRGVDNALTVAEREYRAVMTVQQTLDPADKRTCPGWTVELQAQFGGCGRIVETYRLTNGQTVDRPEGYCSRCRKESAAAARQAQQEQEAA